MSEKEKYSSGAAYRMEDESGFVVQQPTGPTPGAEEKRRELDEQLKALLAELGDAESGKTLHEKE